MDDPSAIVIFLVDPVFFTDWACPGSTPRYAAIRVRKKTVSSGERFLFREYTFDRQCMGTLFQDILMSNCSRRMGLIHNQWLNPQFPPVFFRMPKIILLMIVFVINVIDILADKTKSNPRTLRARRSALRAYRPCDSSSR